MRGRDGLSRRGVVGGGAVSALGLAAGAQAASPETKLDPAAVAAITGDWPKAAKAAADEMLKRYGVPQEATESMLVWRGNGPWKRSVVLKEEADHAFPAPHKETLAQTVDYKVPLNFYNALAVYNGSVVAHRTRGELTAYGDRESTNILSLNLAQEVLRGRMSAEQAREAHARAAREMASGGDPELARKLLIESQQQGDMTDPDTPATPDAPKR